MPLLRPPPRRSSSAWGAAWEGTLEAVFSVVIAAGIGFYLDSYAGTEPLLLAVGFVIGGIAAVRRLLRISADGLDGGSTPGASDRTPPPRAGDEPSPRDAANPPDA